MKIFILTTILVLGSMTAWAQEQPGAQAADKPVAKLADKLPAEVNLTQSETDRLRLRQLRLQNLSLQAQLAREQLAKLEQEAKEEQTALQAEFADVASKHGLKGEDTALYDVVNGGVSDKGPIRLKRKPPAPATPAK